MNATLPDVARTQSGDSTVSLDEVGMENIAVPVRLNETGAQPVSAGSADLLVDFPGGETALKGIHMSRLYRLLVEFSEAGLSSPAVLERLMQECVDSHEDCASTRALLRLRFPLMLSRPALVSRGLSGWRSYPLEIEAEMDRRRDLFRVRLHLDVTYSSTCPCSAALAGQVISQTFRADLGNRARLAPGEVLEWLEHNAMIATPHSQRSVASVSVLLDPAAGNLGATGLIDEIEATLLTPVQTLVRRSDEQAFARLNGVNPMYVEDAARRLAGALRRRHHGVRVQVRHMESLHAHDAVARA